VSKNPFRALAVIVTYVALCARAAANKARTHVPTLGVACHARRAVATGTPKFQIRVHVSLPCNYANVRNLEIEELTISKVRQAALRVLKRANLPYHERNSRQHHQDIQHLLTMLRVWPNYATVWTLQHQLARVVDATDPTDIIALERPAPTYMMRHYLKRGAHSICVASKIPEMSREIVHKALKSVCLQRQFKTASVESMMYLAGELRS
jgi:hypothetical protein